MYRILNATHSEFFFYFSIHSLEFVTLEKKKKRETILIKINEKYFVYYIINHTLMFNI